MPQNGPFRWLQGRFRREADPDAYDSAAHLICCGDYEFPQRFLGLIEPFKAAVHRSSQSVESIALAVAILTAAGFHSEAQALRCEQRSVELVILVYMILLDMHSQCTRPSQDRPPAYVDSADPTCELA